MPGAESAARRAPRRAGRARACRRRLRARRSASPRPGRCCRPPRSTAHSPVMSNSVRPGRQSTSCAWWGGSALYLRPEHTHTPGADRTRRSRPPGRAPSMSAPPPSRSPGPTAHGWWRGFGARAAERAHRQAACCGAGVGAGEHLEHSEVACGGAGGHTRSPSLPHVQGEHHGVGCDCHSGLLVYAGPLTCCQRNWLHGAV